MILDYIDVVDENKLDEVLFQFSMNAIPENGDVILFENKSYSVLRRIFCNILENNIQKWKCTLVVYK